MKPVLLPGMDGTGDLFAPFVREFGTQTVIVRYPSSSADYAELEAFARRELPLADDFFLLGESFSGPIAIAIAADPPPNLKGLVLCCTFASNPRPRLSPFERLLRFLPAPPLRVLEVLLCGRFANPEVRALLASALGKVPLPILKARARAAMNIDLSAKLRRIHVPTLCLKATEDRIVPNAAILNIVKFAPNARSVELVGPHFLLQTVPSEAAAAIARFMAEEKLA